MKTTYLKCIKAGDKRIPFCEKVNIVTGYTGTAKTLLFGCIEYFFGINDRIVPKIAAKTLGVDKIECTLSVDNEDIALLRGLSESFVGEVQGFRSASLKSFKTSIEKLHAVLRSHIFISSA